MSNIEDLINQEEINLTVKDFSPCLVWKGKRVFGELGNEVIHVFLKHIDTSKTRPVIYYKKVFDLYTTLRQRDYDGKLMSVENIIDSPRWVRINKHQSDIEIWDRDSGKDLFIKDDSQVGLSEKLFDKLCECFDNFEDLKDLRNSIVNILRNSKLEINIDSLQVSKKSLAILENDNDCIGI